jgi:hypothetical protein
MTPPSGHKEKRDVRRAALSAEADRLSSLALPQLAAEVMASGFADVPRYDEHERAYPVFARLISRLAPEDIGPLDGEVYSRFAELVREGLQVLEHASLVCGPIAGSHNDYYALTRLGRSVLERGAVDRYLDGSSR